MRYATYRRSINIVGVIKLIQLRYAFIEFDKGLLGISYRELETYAPLFCNFQLIKLI